MPLESKEWGLVQELMEMIEDLETSEQQDFIRNLFDNLDPNESFLEQCSPKQMDWLYILHDYYVNGNEDAFEDLE